MRATRSILGLGLAAALTIGAVAGPDAGPAAAQESEDASPSAEATEIPVTTKSGRPDLYLDMPYYLGGFEPEILMTRGQEHFEGPSMDDAAVAELRDLLEQVGAEPEDMVTGYALVSQEDFFSFVVAIRVDGIEPGSLLPAYLPILEGDLEDPLTTEDELGGRDILVVDSVGAEGEYVELYVYDEGDTVWILQGPRDVVDAALANLPDPLEASADG